MYGWFNSLFNEKAGIKLIMYWGLWAPILLSFGSFHTYKRLKKKSEIKEKLIDEPDREYSIDDDSSDESPTKKIKGINY